MSGMSVISAHEPSQSERFSALPPTSLFPQPLKVRSSDSVLVSAKKNGLASFPTVCFGVLGV